MDFRGALLACLDASERRDARLRNPSELSDPLAELLQMVASTENAAPVYDAVSSRAAFSDFHHVKKLRDSWDG